MLRPKCLPPLPFADKSHTLQLLTVRPESLYSAEPVPPPCQRQNRHAAPPRSHESRSTFIAEQARPSCFLRQKFNSTPNDIGSSYAGPPITAKFVACPFCSVWVLHPWRTLTSEKLGGHKSSLPSELTPARCNRDAGAYAALELSLRKGCGLLRRVLVRCPLHLCWATH